MNWYLIHTKPKQEQCAKQNLERQGYQCYLPTLPMEKLRKGNLSVTDEPLFPRYLFIQLGKADSAKSWSPIRYTKGVSRLVSFGIEPAKVDNQLIYFLKTQETVVQNQPHRLFTPGERVSLNYGAFSGIEGIYQMTDSESRVMVLIELLSKPIRMSVPLANLRKAS